MKVFMLGWEFPPFISGGLGTACYGLTKAMNQLDIEITFVLPRMFAGQYATHVKLRNPDLLSSTFKIDEFAKTTFHTVNSPLQAYLTPGLYQRQFEEFLRQKQRAGGTSVITTQTFCRADYSGDMYTEVQRYAVIAAELAKNEQLDVIHAHDWMTFPAAIRVAAESGKPLIIHVHSTEFDRSGEHINQMIYDIERQGMHAANKIIAVSNFTRDLIIRRYGVSGEKVVVVHNAVERNGNNDNNLNWTLGEAGIKRDEKIVLFLGRITMQKGPEYFLLAAKKVLEVMENVKFLMAGSGDLMHKAVEMAAGLGIGNKVLFTGFLHGEDVRKIYKMADLFVMPSVS
ncbi:MAG: glycosyltransferase family 4 protein, partial [Planctomycetota bacterium]